ncbi:MULTISPECIES: hypothetical protein [Streptomyces]|uniref:hypothetical protein n=1 Tax=Streptomyces TaxID=1883 RepID=UPI002DDAB6E0|nr:MULTISPECIES: hypothetical protein [unclassified Streptomyces]
MTRKDRGSPRTDSPSRDGAPGVAYTGRGVHRIAVEALARRIFDGTYAEGDLLDLPGLMAELDVSQTVLREAIKVLPPKACWTPGRSGGPSYARATTGTSSTATYCAGPSTPARPAASSPTSLSSAAPSSPPRPRSPRCTARTRISPPSTQH